MVYEHRYEELIIMSKYLYFTCLSFKKNTIFAPALIRRLDRLKPFLFFQTGKSKFFQ